MSDVIISVENLGQAGQRVGLVNQIHKGLNFEKGKRMRSSLTFLLGSFPWAFHGIPKAKRYLPCPWKG